MDACGVRKERGCSNLSGRRPAESVKTTPKGNSGHSAVHMRHRKVRTDWPDTAITLQRLASTYMSVPKKSKHVRPHTAHNGHGGAGQPRPERRRQERPNAGACPSGHHGPWRPRRRLIGDGWRQLRPAVSFPRRQPSGLIAAAEVTTALRSHLSTRRDGVRQIASRVIRK